MTLQIWTVTVPQRKCTSQLAWAGFLLKWHDQRRFSSLAALFPGFKQKRPGTLPSISGKESLTLVPTEVHTYSANKENLIMKETSKLNSADHPHAVGTAH